MDSYEYRIDDVTMQNNNYRNDDERMLNGKSCCEDGMKRNNNSRSGGRGNHVYYEGCEEHKVHDLGCTEMISTGRLLDVTLTLRNVCPRRRVALGVTVNEVDDDGNEAARGFKAVTVPAHTQTAPCDVTAPTLRFVLPEDLNENGQNGGLGRRHFIVRATSHYVDSQANLC